MKKFRSICGPCGGRCVTGAVCLILLLLPLGLSAQRTGQALIDSLTHQLPSVSNDTLRVRLLKRISDEWAQINPDSAMAYVEKGLALVTRMKWKKGIGIFHVAKGVLLSNQSAYARAIDEYRQAYEIHRQNGDKKNMAQTLNDIGAAYQRQSNLTQASDYFFKALQLAEAIGDSTLQVTCNDNLANVYSEENNFKKALSYCQKALSLTDSLNNPGGAASVLEGIGNIYFNQGDSSSASINYQRALHLFESTNNRTGIAEIYTNLSTLAGSDYHKKIDCALRAQKIWDEINPAFVTAIINTGNLGVAYLDILRYDSLHIKPGGNIPGDKKALLQLAETHLQKAILLSRQTGDRNYESYFTGVLAEAQAQGGDYKDAYLNFRKYQNVQDSVFSQDNKNKIASLEEQREIALRDKEIEIGKLALAGQRRQRLALIAGLCLLAVIGGLLYRQNLTRRRTNRTLLRLNAQLDEANRTKATFFGILGHDLRRPVASLLNFLHLQNQAPDLLDGAGEQIHQQRIQRSAEGLLETMESLLLWSKSQLDQFNIQIQDTPLAPIVQQCTRLLNLENGSAQIRLVNEVEEGTRVITDADILFTILRNLLQNAVRATPPNGKIRIWFAGNGQGGSLSIQNEGQTFSQQDYEKLLRDGSGRKGLDGFGLRLVHELSGKIGVTLRFAGDRDASGGGSVSGEISAGTCAEIKFRASVPTPSPAAAPIASSS